MTSAVLAADLGGTKTSAGVVLDGRVHHRLTTPTPASRGADAVVSQLVSMLDAVRTATPDSPTAVAIGSAGVVDADGRISGATDAIRGWAGTDLAGLVGTALGLSAYVVNDVHAHALGEVRYGAGIGRDPVLVVAVGTGVGGALVSGGRVLSGVHGAAGHLGHVPSAAAAGIPCPCGAIGHLEAVASGPGIAATYRRLGGTHDLDGRAVLAATNDPVARQAVELGATALGSALGGWTNLLDPELVVLTGGVAAAGSTWLAQVVAAAAAECVPVVRGVDVVPARLGGDAALLGAAAWAGEREPAW